MDTNKKLSKNIINSKNKNKSTIIDTNKNIINDTNIFIKQNANDKNISITDDNLINQVLVSIGKKSKNANTKNIVDDIITSKTGIQKKNNKKIIESESDDENNETKNTFTSNLTKEDIQKKLEDYKLVDDLTTIPIGTHLRYFVKKNNEMLFRMGGNLKRNFDLPKFIILKNAQGVEWTVQVKDTIFYKKMSITEIKNEYENIINELHDKIKKLKNKIKELEK